MVVVVAVRARAQWVPSSIAMDPGAALWFCEQQTVQGGASPPATAELQWPLRCNREAACPFEHMEAIPGFLSVCECQQAASVGSTATGRCPTGRRTGALCSCALWASEGRAPPPPSARRSPCQQAIGRSPCSCAAARANNRRLGIFVPSVDSIPFWRERGVTFFLMSSDHNFIKQGANKLVTDARGSF